MIEIRVFIYNMVRQCSTQLVNRYTIDNSSGGLTAAIVSCPDALFCQTDEMLYIMCFTSKYSRHIYLHTLGFYA